MKSLNKQAYRDWLGQFDWDVAVNLNMRANISKSHAQNAAKYFWHKLDCDIFGCTQVKIHRTRLVRACFIEGEAGVRNFHYHAAVQLPAPPSGTTQSHDDRVARFGEMLKLRWEQLREAGSYSVCHGVHHGTGWIDYICKDVDRGDNAFCTLTSHLPL